MYRKQIAQKASPSLQSTSKSQDIAPSPSYGSLSSVVQRVQQDPNSVSEDERQQLESAIGTRSTREILAGKQTPWVPEFQGISAQLGAPIQAKSMDDVGISQAQPENKTGLPDNLKAGIENLSGMAMDDVSVHYNSSKPSELQALAYTQGTEIHVAPGQEKHLPHEAWHVVQQKQGRVKPMIQVKGVGINDDEGLEREADVMGSNAIQKDITKLQEHKSVGVQKPSYTIRHSSILQKVTSDSEVIQCAKVYKKWVLGLPHWEVVFQSKDIESGNPCLWQVGFANPTAIKDTSGSVGTKSGSPIGYGGEGEVHWTKLNPGKEVKGGYQFILEDSSQGACDSQLESALPKDGTREKYRLTSNNCQHFIVNAWKDAELSPDLESYLTMSKNTGDYVNSGLLGGLVGATGAVLIGGATVLSLPTLAVGAMGAGAAMGALKYLSKTD
ncbi:DUF4157 domain-containing protein [Calothrix sp. PCC 7507]|uniref:eCIS core domain-containing protein n=1 Tax=Calothrix sp. PCC 7507 TaxID=99598 RepID=UPI00029F3B4B|nr:DUF4157 domain-containing protein [Calothrix sp. PCC 7507]AFY33603.1 hypothetical protein Cal7507_3195 [Calothrix sp. PCC 7507]